MSMYLVYQQSYNFIGVDTTLEDATARAERYVDNHYGKQGAGGDRAWANAGYDRRWHDVKPQWSQKHPTLYPGKPIKALLFQSKYNGTDPIRGPYILIKEVKNYD